MFTVRSSMFTYVLLVTLVVQAATAAAPASRLDRGGLWISSRAKSGSSVLGRRRYSPRSSFVSACCFFRSLNAAIFAASRNDRLSVRQPLISRREGEIRTPNATFQTVLNDRKLRLSETLSRQKNMSSHSGVIVMVVKLVSDRRYIPDFPNKNKKTSFCYLSQPSIDIRQQGRQKRRQRHDHD